MSEGCESKYVEFTHCSKTQRLKSKHEPQIVTTTDCECSESRGPAEKVQRVKAEKVPPMSVACSDVKCSEGGKKVRDPFMIGHYYYPRKQWRSMREVNHVQMKTKSDAREIHLYT